MALSDVIAVTRTSDGTIFGGRARVKQLVVHTSGSGSPAVVLKDGGSGGTTTAATETADEVEVVISGTAGAGGVVALKFFGLSSDSPTA